MIYAQRNILTSKLTWAIHLRADSSPQGGRDFFLSEYDVLHMEGQLSQQHVKWLFYRNQLRISKRILPVCILGQRASTTVHKAQQLLHALSLESESLSFSVQRTFSLLTDFGAEGGMINMPGSFLDKGMNAGANVPPIEDIADDDGHSTLALATDGSGFGLESAFHRLFGKAMPIADTDHSVHHAASLVILEYFLY